MRIDSIARRIVLASILISSAPVAAWPARAAKPSTSGPVRARAPLRPNALDFLPLGSIKPAGWLRRQLEIQASGLTGHLDEVWADVGPNSGWLGGTGESWERGPYYLDGLVPLAYLTGDPKLIAKAQQRVNWILSHQSPDGWLGPERNKDWWPNIVALKALTQYQEATGDPRVIPAMQRYFRYQAAHLGERPLHEWDKFRWADEVLSILWLYDRAADPMLLDLARTLQTQGHNWKSEFADFPFTGKTNLKQLGLTLDEHSEVALSAHGVNNAMALKTSAVWWRVSGEDGDRRAAGQQMATLDEYHLLPNGMFSCDEHLAGHDPSQGTELCSVVETQFSLEQLISILGDARLGDRLERITYNALPATVSDDMWAHQYDQQANQVLCTLQPRDWTTNGPESNTFGLEPNFGCCTANLHQGWPKFVASLWMATPEGGLAAVAYGPNQVTTVMRGKTRVRINEDTKYPFAGGIRLTIDPAEPTEFPLKLRIPEWVEGARVSVNGRPWTGKVRPGAFYTVARRWTAGDRVELTLPLRVRTSEWYHDSVELERGPLIFSLKIGEEWRKIDHGMSHPANPPAADWEVVPTTPWNYGLILNNTGSEKSVSVVESPVGEFPFSAKDAPVALIVQGRRIPAWKLANGSAGPLPPSPVESSERVESLTLIPYGAAKLRITAFPRLAN